MSVTAIAERVVIWGAGGHANLPVMPLATDAAGTVFDFSLLDIINAYYPASQTKVSLTIATLDTANTFVPDDFINVPFDDATMIARHAVRLRGVRSAGVQRVVRGGVQRSGRARTGGGRRRG